MATAHHAFARSARSQRHRARRTPRAETENAGVERRGVVDDVGDASDPTMSGKGSLWEATVPGDELDCGDILSSLPLSPRTRRCCAVAPSRRRRGRRVGRGIGWSAVDVGRRRSSQGLGRVEPRTSPFDRCAAYRVCATSHIKWLSGHESDCDLRLIFPSESIASMVTLRDNRSIHGQITLLVTACARTVGFGCEICNSLLRHVTVGR